MTVELTGFVGILRSGHRTDPNLFVCFAAQVLPGQDRPSLQAAEKGKFQAGAGWNLAEIEAEVVPLRSGPFKNLFRRLSEGRVYPVDAVQHEPLDDTT